MAKKIDYTALMCDRQSLIAKQGRKNPQVVVIADLLNIRCHQLCNDGVFENARELLNDPDEVGGMFLNGYAEIILAGDAPGFWHWEDDRLVVDCYSLEAQSKYLNEKRRGHTAGVASGQSRRSKSTKNADSASDRTHVQTHVEHTLNKERKNTPYGSKSKDTPTLGAGGAFDDDSPDGEPATQEDMQAFFDSAK